MPVILIIAGILALVRLFWPNAAIPQIQHLNHGGGQTPPKPQTTTQATTTVVRPGTTKPPIRVGPITRTLVTIRPGVTHIVQPPQQALWQDRGWKLQKQEKLDIYEGTYRVTDSRGQRRTFPGQVHVTRWHINAYIAHLPKEIKEHPKAPCFASVNPPWCQLKWFRPAKHVDEAILYMERVLDEALNPRRKTA